MRGLALALVLGGAAFAQTLTRPPAHVEGALPPYPADGDGRTVTVRLLITIEADGAVSAVDRVGPPAPPFDAAAIEAVRAWRFTPAELDGVPSAVRVPFTVTFAPTVAAPEPAPTHPPEPPPAPPDLPAPDLPGTSPGPPDLPGTSPASPDPDALRVVGRRVAPPPAGSTARAAAPLRVTAGAAGDPTVAAQALPAVARPSAGSGALIVWGADADATRILVDGVPVPALYHEGGLRGVLPPALVDTIVLTPAGFGPAHGRAVGGLLEVETTPPAASALRGEVAVDVLDASALVEARPAPPLTLLVAGRFGWLDHTLPALAPDAEALVPASAWRDYAARVALDHDGAETRVIAFGALDAVDRAGLAVEPGVVPRATVDRAFHRVALHHDRAGGARLTLWYGDDRDTRAARFGATATRVDLHARRGGARLARAIGPLRLGLDLEATHTEARRTGTLALPPREGDRVVFGQSPGDGVNRDRWARLDLGAAAYARLDLRLFDRLDLSPGLRVEPRLARSDRRLPVTPGAVETGADRWAAWVEPRLSAAWRLTERLTTRLAGGLYHQPPAAADTSPVFGGAALDGPRAVHALAGLRWRAPDGLDAELALFARRTDGLTARTTEASPPAAALLVDAGAGRAHGAQATVRTPAWEGLTAQLAYALTVAERRAHDAAPWRPFDGEQRHGLNAAVSWSAGPWSLGGRLRLASGRPTPRVIGATWDAAHGRFDPLFADDPDRLPTFAQLDLRLGYTHRLPAADVEASLEVINVTDRDNVEAWVYRADYGARAPLTGLPLLGVAGLRVAWR